MAAAAALNSAKHQSDEPVVGDAPKHELLQPRAATNKRKAVDNEGAKSSKPSRPHTSTAQPTERASDDYCLERFKKNMKFSRGSKIKIGQTKVFQLFVTGYLLYIINQFILTINYYIEFNKRFIFSYFCLVFFLNSSLQKF